MCVYSVYVENVGSAFIKAFTLCEHYYVEEFGFMNLPRTLYGHNGPGCIRLQDAMGWCFHQKKHLKGAFLVVCFAV